MTVTETPSTANLDQTMEPVVAYASPHWSGVAPDSQWLARAKALRAPLAEWAAEHDEKGTFVQEGFDLLTDNKFMSLLVPTELGGGGATHAEACAVLAELAKGCPATSLSYSMHSHIVAAQVWRHHRALSAPVLGRVAADELTLISTGASDWIDSSGTATRTDGGFRVSARKMPASGCPAGDVLVTSVRWEDAPDGQQIVHCSIPFAANGVSIIETWNTMGMRGTGSHTVVVDDVFVPDEAVALIRPAGQWHPVWATVLVAALPLIMSSYIGVAEVAAEAALALAGRRAERPDIAPQIGRMLNRLTTARDTVRAMIDAAADLRFDNTIEAASAALARKTNATGACIDTVRMAIEVGGGPAYSKGSVIERMFRDVHGSLYHPLAAEKQIRFSGRLALGLDPIR